MGYPQYIALPEPLERPLRDLLRGWQKVRVHRETGTEGSNPSLSAIKRCGARPHLFFADP